MALSKYRLLGSGHHISSFSKCGGYLMLEDRSVWSLEATGSSSVHHEFIDTEDMVVKWFRRWQDQLLLPAP